MRETARYVDAVHLACPPVECQNVRDCQGLVLFNSVQFGYFLVGGVTPVASSNQTSDGDNSTTTSSALHIRVTEDGDYFSHTSGADRSDFWEDDVPIHRAGYLTELLGSRAVEVVKRLCEIRPTIHDQPTLQRTALALGSSRG